MPKEPEKGPPETWQPWRVPEHLRRGGGGGWCVVLGEPDERTAVGRQVGGVPTLERAEAEAIAAALNALTPAPAEVDAVDG